MMIEVRTEIIVKKKCNELMARSPESAWAACASIWARTFVLAGPGWVKWDNFLPVMCEAYLLAMSRASGRDIQKADLVLSKIESFDVEDDGSAEWQYVIDLIAMISSAIDGEDISTCLHTSLQAYLEGAVNVLANIYADADGKPISVTEVNRRLSKDPSWKKTVDFVLAL